MVGVVLIGSKDSPVEVTGAHGGASSLLWKRFTDGNMMYSDLQSFEHVTVPAGGNVGLHVHSRTEEIYFIVGGRGQEPVTVVGRMTSLVAVSTERRLASGPVAPPAERLRASPGRA